MAASFLLSAVVQVQTPSNLGAVRANIASQLAGISVPVNVSVRMNTPAVTQIVKLKQNMQQVSKAATQAADSVQAFGERSAIALRRFGGFAVATAGFFSLISAIKQATSEAVEFDQQVIKLRQAAGASASGIQALVSEIDRLSTSFGVSSKELSQASLILVQAGLSAKDTRLSLDALAKSDLAPTFDSIGETAEAAIAIFSQFKKEGKDLEGILGSINEVSARFAVESDDIATAVRRTGGAFQASGGSLEELIALFTSVRATTRESAETISTGFRTIFTRLQRGRTQKFLDDFGISLRFTAEEAERFGQTAGNFVGPYEAVRRLSTALKDLDSADPRFAQIVEELGGFRQISKVIPLIQQFGTAQQALSVAFSGTDSLAEDAITSQEALARQFAKVREEFNLLIRDLSNNSAMRDLIGLSLDLASSLIQITKALQPILPLLIGTFAFKGALGAKSFFKGFGSGLTRPLPTTSLSGFASGGSVPGTGNRDSVPAMLMPGEFVLNKKAVNRLGVSTLEGINNGSAKGFAAGGLVGRVKENFSNNKLTIGAASFGAFLLLNSQAEKISDEFGQLGGALSSLVVQFVLLKGILGSFNNTNAQQKIIETSQGKIDTSKGNLDNLFNSRVAAGEKLRSILERKAEIKTVDRSERDEYVQLKYDLDEETVLANRDSIKKRAREISKNTFARRDENRGLRVDEFTVKTEIADLKEKEKTEKAAITAQQANIKTQERAIATVNGLNLALAGLSSILLVVGDVYNRQAQVILENLRKGDSSDFSGFRQSAVTGGFATGGGQGAAIGSAVGGGIGALIGLLGGAGVGALPGGAIGAAAGGAIGTTVGLVAGGTSAGNQADIQIDTVRFNREFEKFEQIIKNFNEGKSSVTDTSGRIAPNLSGIKDRLITLQDPQARQDLSGQIENTIPSLQKLIDTAAGSSASLDEFRSSVGTDLINFFSQITNQPISELEKSANSIIEQRQRELGVNEKLLKQTIENEQRVRLQIQFASAVQDAAVSVTRFDSALNSFLVSGGFDTKVSFKSGDLLSRLGSVSDSGLFSRELGRTSGIFGDTSRSLTGESVASANVIRELPSLLNRLSAQDPFGEGGEFISRFEDAVRSIPGVSDTVAQSFVGGAREVIGPTLNDQGILEGIRGDLQGTIKRISDNAEKLAEPLRDAVVTFESELNNYLGVLSKRTDIERQINDERSSLLTISGDRERFNASANNRQVNFAKLGGLEKQRDINALRDPSLVNNPEAIAAKLQASQEKLVELQNSLATSTGLTGEQMAKLGQSIVAQQGEVLRLNDGLRSLADASKRSALLQEQLSKAQRDRETKFDLAREFTFSSPQERNRLNQTLSLASVAAFSNDIEQVPAQFRREVEGLLQRFGDTAVPGLAGRTGNQVINSLSETTLRRQGINAAGITKPNTEEASLISKIDEVFATAEEAQTKLIEFMGKNQADFFTTLESKFSEFLTKLREGIQGSEVKSIEEKIAGNLNDQSIAQRNLRNLGNIQSLSGGLSPEIARNNITAITESAEERRRLQQGLLQSGVLRNVATQRSSLEVFEQDTVGKFGTGQSNNKSVLKQLGFGSEAFEGRVSSNGFIDRQGVDQLLNNLQQKLSPFGDDVATKFVNEFRNTRQNKAFNSDANGFNAATIGGQLQDALFEFFKAQETRQSALETERQTRVGGLSNDPAQAARIEQALIANQRALEDLLKNSPQLDPRKIQEQILFLQKEKQVLDQNLQKARGFNTGGFVPGVGNGDTVPAMLTPGEFVLNKQAVNNIGIGKLHSMNRDNRHVQHFAIGGIVKAVRNTGVTTAIAKAVSGGGSSSPEAKMNLAYVQQMNSGFVRFNNSVERLAKVFESMPTEIVMTGRHQVEVIVNGAQVMQNIMPEIAKLVESGAKNSINKMLKEKFPEVGQM